MADHFLQLYEDKTEILMSAPPSVVPNIRDGLGSLTSSVKSSIRSLGVTMDQHVKCQIRSCFFQLGNTAKLRTIVSQVEMEMLIHAFISSRLDYCNSLFTCLSKTSLDRLQVVQNAAAKLLTRFSKRSHVTPILIALHWLSI